MDQTIVPIRPGMLFHWSDGPKLVIDTQGFGFDPSIHGDANIVYADAKSAADMLNSTLTPVTFACYFYGSDEDFQFISHACNNRSFTRLVFPPN